MKNMHLIRQDHNNPDIYLLDQSNRYLFRVLDETPCAREEEIDEIVHFQDADGSFRLLDSYYIDPDACVGFCHLPTYLATAILMKAYLQDSGCLSGKEESVFIPALKRCCDFGLCGHGYDDLSGQIEAMRIFLRAGVHEFIRKYPAMCPDFTMMIYSVVDQYRSYIAKGEYVFYFGENHEKDFHEIVAHFPEECYIFVYGTLLMGQRNYAHFLAPEEPCATAVLGGYRMYDIGSFPGIVPGDGYVKGEVYRVNARQLAAINRLEGEGDLYIKTPVDVKIKDNVHLSVSAYVYNCNVKGLPEIPFDKQPYGKIFTPKPQGKDDKVWYVAYGSNLLTERFGYYIKGGTCPYNGCAYKACADSTMPEKSKPVIIPHDMFYSNYNKSSSWEESAVCFLDVTKPGKAYGRAWLVTIGQLEEIHAHEGKGKDWYFDAVQLDDMDGIPAYTFTNRSKKPHEAFLKVSPLYAIILYRGMKETYPEMSDDEIISYLDACGK